MKRNLFVLTLGLAFTIFMSACGGSGSKTPPTLVSYVGTTGVFAAWATGNNSASAFAPMGSYAGKRQVLRGTVDFTTGTSLSQAAGVEVYKGSDGHIHALDLTSTSTPAAQQLSTESAATVDDLCSFTGTTAGTGAF